MSSINKLSTRKIIGIVAIIGVVGVLGVGGAAQTGLVDGITDAVGLTNSDDMDGTVFDAVPKRSNSVTMLDPVGLAEDPVTENVGNYILTQELNDTNQTYSQLVDESYSNANSSIKETLQSENINATLEVQDFGRVVVFSDINSSRLERITGTSQVGSLTQGSVSESQDLSPEEFSDIYSGAVFELDANESEVSSIYQRMKEDINAEQAAEVTFEESGYKDRTLYTASNETISVSFATIDSDNGYHSIGRTEVVKDTIDTYLGDAESVDTEVGENTYFTVRTSGIEQKLDADQFEQLNKNATVTEVFVSYSTNGQDEAMLTAEISLQNIQNAIDYKNTLESTLDGQEDNNLVKNIDVNSEGATIEVEYNATTQEIKQGINDTLESFAERFSGASSSQADTVSEVPDEGASVLFSQEVDNRDNGTYNLTSTVAQTGQSDYIVIKKLGNSGGAFPDVTEGEGPIYGSYPNESIVSYISTHPDELSGIPSDASNTEVVDSQDKGAVLVSQGDEVVVTNVASSETVQVFSVNDGRTNLVDSYTLRVR